MKPSRDALFTLVLALFALTILPEIVHPKREMIYDDQAVVDTNEHVRARDFAAIWSSPYWGGVKKLYHQENLHRPMFLTVVAIFRENTGILRALVMLSHCVLGLLLWLVLQRIPATRAGPEDAPARLWAGLATVCLFLWHPAQVEVTAQVIGLMETVPVILGIAALLLLDRQPVWAILIAGLAPGWKELGYVWLASVAFVFGVRRQYAFAAAAGGVIAAWLAHRYAVYGALFASGGLPYTLLNPLVGMEPLDAFLSRFTLLGENLKLFALPFALSSDYSRGTIPVPGYLVQVNVLVAVAFLLWLWRRWRGLPVYALVALATLLPTLHLTGPTGIIFGERYGYSFRFGLCVLVAIGLQKAVAALESPDLLPWVKKTAAGAFAVVLLIFYGQSFVRHGDWTSGERLFRKDISRYPFNPKLHFNLGMHFGGQKRWQEAREEFSRALDGAPDFPEAHFRTGIVLRELGQDDAAQLHWKIADELGHPVPTK